MEADRPTGEEVGVGTKEGDLRRKGERGEGEDILSRKDR